jgi:hypothetical protein
MILLLQVVAVLLASIAMSLALAHALELPGKLRLNKEDYIVTQTIYYPGFTIGGIGEALAVVAALALLLTTPSYNVAYWWTLAGFLCLLAMQAVYWVLTHPVNKFWTKDLDLRGLSAGFFAFGRKPAVDTSNKPDEKWINFRNRWEYSHVFRALLSMAALISLTVATAIRGTS